MQAQQELVLHSGIRTDRTYPTQVDVLIHIQNPGVGDAGVTGSSRIELAETSQTLRRRRRPIHPGPGTNRR